MRRLAAHHAVVPSRFPVQVRQAAQRRPPSEPLLSVRVIQRRVRRRNFALWSGSPGRQIGRSLLRDYYGHSVAIGLASLRRSHVRKCCTSEHDLGVLSVSLNVLTGHRSRPGGLRQAPKIIPPQGLAPVYGCLSGGCSITPSGDWDSGNPTFALSRGSPGAPPRRFWARPPVSWVEVGCRTRCHLRPFSRAAPSRTRHASFPATGSPVTMP